MTVRNLQWLLPLFLVACVNSQGTSLAGGRFVATTDVSSWADLALDAAAMRESESIDEKKEIYSNGRNAVYSEDGTDKIRSLAGLSLNSYPQMAQDALYNIYRHAFLKLGNEIEGETLGNFDQKPVTEYANTLVNDLFALNVNDIETEAALVTCVWMAIVHELYNVLRSCQTYSKEYMNAALDRAAAMWIGSDQPAGVNDAGNMLYNLAQIAGERFNQANGEARANQLLVDAMNDLQASIAAGMCSNGEVGDYLTMRKTVNFMISYMTIPLVQILIHHIQQQPADGGGSFVELYALSFAPRVAACDPTGFEEILSLMVDVNLSVDDKEEAVGVVQDTLSCLQLTCEDIGSYQSGQVPTCDDDLIMPAGLAEFTPTYDLNPYGFFDRDILQIRILTRTMAYEAALDYYKYGYNVREEGNVYVSLQELATSDDRLEAGDQFDLYANYFDNDDYADELILAALTAAPTDQASDVQLAEIVAGYLTNLVMYMAIVEKLYAAVDACNTPATSEAGLRLVDQAAAFYIGSIEGEQDGGLDGGQLLYATSKSLCGNFSKCDVNQRILDAFDEMSSKLVEGSCDELLTIVQSSIEPLLPVPLIQGALHYAVINSKLEAGDTAASLGTADAFAFSVVPYVDSVDEVLGVSLLANLQFNSGVQPVAEGPAAVFDIMRNSVTALGLDCNDIGTYPNFGSVCVGGSSTPTTSPGGAGPEPTASSPTTPSPTPDGAPTAVGFGRYPFSIDTSLAGLALDVRDIQNAATDEAATAVYANGANAQLDGKPISLASLSLDAQNSMAQDIAFNLVRFSLAESPDFGQGSYQNASTYADITFQKALSVADDQRLAAESTVILHVWMQIANFLYGAVRTCGEGGPAVNGVDNAVAIWVGAGQTEGSDENGYLLYSIAEKAATRFGRSKDAEAPINTELFDKFNQARTVALECPDTADMFLDLRLIVSDILRSMSFPLVQNLIYYMDKARTSAADYTVMENFVELYAVSVVPGQIGCNPTAVRSLQETIISKDFDFSLMNDEIISHMKSIQKCLHIDCADFSPDQITDNDLKATVQMLCYNTHELSIAGYKPATDVNEYLKLDLDVTQIGILAETEAFDAAVDMYVNGYNSRLPSDEKRALSLKSLATDPRRSVVPDQYNQFSSYYSSDSFSDEEIMGALKGEGAYSSASSQQRRELAMRMLQTMVCYMTVLTNLYTAVEMCNAGDVEATSYWDKAVAMFVGSIEGEIRGGDINDYGELLYSLAKEFCDDFGTCESSEDASSNEALIDSLSDGLVLVDERKCDSAARLIESEVLPQLPISLVQGTLYTSTQMEDLLAGSTDDILAAGYVFSRAVLPLVNAANVTSAEVIGSNMNFQLTSDPVPDNSPAIFDAFTFAIHGMDVNCEDIGILGDRSVCSDVVKPHSTTPTDLSGDLYTTTTYVQDRANIALDVLAIRNALQGGSADLAKLIYKDGENSDLYNENGVTIGQRSLMSFSTDAPTLMAGEPLYNIFRYAMQDHEAQFLGNEVGLYADFFVNEAFQSNDPAVQLLAGEAVVVYNVWMYLAHELYQTLDTCKNKTLVDMDGIHSIDEAVAYWIGDGQVTGDAEQGHLLYALSEQMGDRFGVDESGQSRTNTNILRLFNQAKLELSLPTACTDNPETFPRLFQIVNKIISWMTVPLVQGLIHSMRTNDKEHVKLYARSVLPMVAVCSNATYTDLSRQLFNAEYNVVEVDNIIAHLETTYECLGITCDDIGVHESQSTQTCEDTPVLNPLAGYIPETDVRSFALIDLDIRESNILMKMEALGAAEDLYMHGKHAVIEDESGRQTISLYELATTSGRSIVPQYDSFERYYENERYADVIIRRGLFEAELPSASPEQRREIVVKGMQYIVLYMAALQEMYLSEDYCKSQEAVKILDAEEAWDRASAYLIGSTEGPDDGGTPEGQSFYALARERCDQFGTCTPEGRSSWNDELISKLYTGRGSVVARACGELRKTVTEIERLLLVPLIQSTLRYALANEKLEAASKDGDLAEGYIFSRSVLPLVQDSNRESATTIDKNLDFQLETRPMQDGAGAVWSAFAKAYGNMGVECELIGAAEGYDACNGATSPSSASSEDNAGMIVGIVVGVLALIAIVVLVYYDRRRRQHKEINERPIFVASKGELNHTPDGLVGDSFPADNADYDDEDYDNLPDRLPHLSESAPATSVSSNGETAPLDSSGESSYSID